MLFLPTQKKKKNMDCLGTPFIQEEKDYDVLFQTNYIHAHEEGFWFNLQQN